MNPEEVLIDAIQSRQNVSFEYQGHVRECSPHAIGRKRGVVHVLVYQFGGSSSSGQIMGDSDRNWRCMDVSQIVDVELIDGDWHTFNNHLRPATCIDEMIAEVNY